MLFTMPSWKQVSQELKTVSYHKLYDILKKHQNKVNEIKAERLARTANPLALITQQQPVYHPQPHLTHYTQNSSTKLQQAATKNREKPIVNYPQPIYNQEPAMVAEDDKMDETDDEPDDQELKAHYLYMEHIQEVTLDAANNYGPIFDVEPLQKVKNDNDNYNVFANDREHPEQPESINDTYLAKQDDTNITIDSLDMSTNGETIDQDDDDLAKERDLLASLIEKLKCEIDDSKNREDTNQSSSPPIEPPKASQMVSSMTKDEAGNEVEVSPVTAQQILAMTKERKAKSTLHMAILDEHLARFHGIKDVKTLWAAIKTRFSEGLDKGYDRFQRLLSLLEIHGADNLDIDDLYNNLKVYEADIKGSSGSFSNLQNAAFVSAESTSSTNDLNAAYSVSTATSHTRNLGNMGRDAGNAGYKGRDNVGFDKTKVECFNCHRRWHFARDYKTARNLGNMGRDAGNAGYKGRDNGKRLAREEDEKALGHPYQALKNKGIFDSRCSRHMTGNKAYLADYQEINDGGFVAFGSSKGKITGKEGKAAQSHPALVIKLHNKTPYELLNGRSPRLDFIRPFGCPVTILNILDPLGKFEGKADEGFLVGYSVTSKAFQEVSDQHYIVLPLWSSVSSTYNSSDDKAEDDKPKDDTGSKTVVKPVNKEDQAYRDTLERLMSQEKEASDATDSLSKEFEQGDGGPSYPHLDAFIPDDTLLHVDSQIPNLEDTVELRSTDIFTIAYDNELDTFTSPIQSVGTEADFNHMESSTIFSPIPTHRVHIDHPKDQILGDPRSAVQTRGMAKKSFGAHAFVSYIHMQRRTNHKDYKNCLFACFLSQMEPKKVAQALDDKSWVEAMQDELLQFSLQKVWRLVDLPYGKKAIGTKWMYRNKKDERVIVVRNKARLVAQGHRKEEGIDYDEVFASMARIEAIKIFLAFASFMGFIIYQMDVKSAFLYAIIEKECMGIIDKTLFIKTNKDDIMLVQVYVDDIIFGSTKKSLCDEFEAMMHKRFQMSFIGELTFFLGLQTQKPLVKDEEAADVDVHLYRSMIGSLMYLKGQPKFGLWYPRDSPFDLEAYSDNDYAGANLDRKSTTRGCHFLGRRLISWQWKKQTIVVTSTTKAEYVAAANYYGQVLWIQNQMLDYGFNFMNTKIYIDNESIICIVKNPMYHSKTKHIEIRHHFIRDSYEKKLIQVLKIHIADNVVDLLTKAFDVSKFNFLKANIRMLNL
uniref:Reverse transcriptase Ty1/copia-type domain-containing protein n=1 Tax=Tanacetum cinerariifolium TaxID=118510 RepID=A0A6L2NYN1_TANCI|nr:hypothetical protein [Tanacetum cinerariifolium]